ncbi:uncharacterized protein LOC116977168 [Amblyraja radiata]|uniref:uncharacterized protein LOC116977168 n=1 Tax=Amblyraja radiata TaxID=386614 RepID=UPI001402DA48|nr:uncharacterized protein LOC116977168 [Amblyraja radiata]
MWCSICKTMGLLWLLTGLYTVELYRAGMVATVGSITTIPVGGTVRFPLLHYSQEKVKVRMRRIDPYIGILGWKSNSPEFPHWINSSYRDRVHFRRDAFIELRAVGPSDQGAYEVQTIYNGSEMWKRDHFMLRVVEPMSTPTVEVSCNLSHLTLNCSTVSGCLVTYRWEQRSQDPGVENATFPGAVLYLPNTGQLNYTYTCVTEDCCSNHAVPATLQCNNLPRGSRNRWMIVLTMFLLVVVAVLCVWTSYRHRNPRQYRECLTHPPPAPFHPAIIRQQNHSTTTREQC